MVTQSKNLIELPPLNITAALLRQSPPNLRPPPLLFRRQGVWVSVLLLCFTSPRCIYIYSLHTKSKVVILIHIYDKLSSTRNLGLFYFYSWPRSEWIRIEGETMECQAASHQSTRKTEKSYKIPSLFAH